MSGPLLLLCAAAFAIVADLSSGAIAVAFPALSRLAGRLSPRHRVRLWLALAALPAIVGALSVLVSFLPAIGIGSDHCVEHGAPHPHLCPHHAGEEPGIVLLAVAVVLLGRTAYGCARFGRTLLLSRKTSRSLLEASDHENGVFVFPANEPQAFVLGALEHRVHVSRGLLSLGSDIVEPVLAHERVHARRRDLLWRAIGRLLGAAHLPQVAASIESELSAAQETAADFEAADTMHDGRLRIAEALVALTRVSRLPSTALSFTSSDVESRVRALLAGGTNTTPWPARFVLAAGLAVPIVVGLTHDHIHHGLEVLLGFLS